MMSKVGPPGVYYGDEPGSGEEGPVLLEAPFGNKAAA